MPKFALDIPSSQIFFCSLAVAAALLGDAILYVVMPSQPELWGITIVQVGILLSANRIIRLLTNPLSSEIMRKYGVVKPFMGAMCSSVIVLVIYAYSKNFFVLLLGRLAWGACWSLLRLGAQWTALEESKGQNLGFNLSYNASVIRIGAIGGALFGGILSDVIGVRNTLLIFGIATVLSLIAWIRQIPESYKVKPAAVQSSRQYSTILRNPRLLLVNMCSLLTGLIWSGAVSGTIGHYLRYRFGLEIEVLTVVVGISTFTGIMLGVRSLAEVFIGPAGGYLSDQYGRVKALVITMVFAAGSIMLLSLNLGLLASAVVLIVTFVSGVLVTMQLLALVGEMAEDMSRTETLSVYSTFQDFGSALGPFIGLSLIEASQLPELYRTGGFILLFFAAVFPLISKKQYLRIGN
ncbi:MAG: MFS transporter [Dehalococcoidia bacterium]|nr:MFS transporter [Dehalococcoidia bacterium]